MNLDQLASRLMVDKVLVSRERYQSSASAKSEIVSNLVFAFYAEDGVDTEDPSNVKRFVSSFSAEQGGWTGARLFASNQLQTRRHHGRALLEDHRHLQQWHPQMDRKLIN